PLLVADHDDWPVLEPTDPAHDGGVFRKVAVPGQRRELVDQRVHVVQAMRPVRSMTVCCLASSASGLFALDISRLRRPSQAAARDAEPTANTPPSNTGKGCQSVAILSAGKLACSSLYVPSILARRQRMVLEHKFL